MKMTETMAAASMTADNVMVSWPMPSMTVDSVASVATMIERNMAFIQVHNSGTQ